MRFEWLRLRFSFTALENVQFPPVLAANVLRGAMGLLSDGGLHSEIFAPMSDGGPSGLADQPRPFVFRARHLDGVTVEPGQSFTFDVHLFRQDEAAVAHLRETFAKLEVHGLGPTRGRVRMTDFSVAPEAQELERGAPATAVTVEFLTPTELKARDELVAEPDFPALLSRARDRVCTLAALYGPHALTPDFTGMNERARRVHMVRAQLRNVAVTRKSTRTGQTHPLGGFVGKVRFEGEVTEFIPWLLAAQATGVGRQAVWGKGEIRVGIA